LSIDARVGGDNLLVVGVAPTPDQPPQLLITSGSNIIARVDDVAAASWISLVPEAQAVNLPSTPTDRTSVPGTVLDTGPSFDGGTRLTPLRKDLPTFAPNAELEAQARALDPARRIPHG